MSGRAMPVYLNLPKDRQKKARDVLSYELGVPIADDDADAICEQIWNALVGHPMAADEE